MIYHSTRSLENGVNAREALLKGLCDDGGLYVSDELSQVSPQSPGSSA